MNNKNKKCNGIKLTSYLNVTRWTISALGSFNESHSMPPSGAFKTFTFLFIFLVEPCWANWHYKNTKNTKTKNTIETNNTLSRTIDCAACCLPEQILLWFANWPTLQDSQPIAPSMGAIDPSSHGEQKNDPSLLEYVPSRQISHSKFAVPFLLYPCGQSKHTREAFKGANLPLSHDWHTTEFCPLVLLPAGQSSHPTDREVWLNLPPTHDTHSSCSVTFVYRPGLHDKQFCVHFCLDTH